MIIDQTHWDHIAVRGSDRVRFMQGMCTANIEQLQGVGDWLRASVLDHRGRVQSVIEVAERGSHLLLTCQPGLGEKTRDLLAKYAIMDDVEFELVEQPMHRVWRTPDDVWTAAPLFSPPPADQPLATPEEYEIARVEAGMPIYGVDVSEDYFPFESLLSRHIDYEKGCYLGQEPVSRVHHRGSPNKIMRGLRVQGRGPVPVGTTVVHGQRADAGRVTSCVESPRFGTIALAYVHRSVAEPGQDATVEGRTARIVALPFTSSPGLPPP